MINEDISSRLGHSLNHVLTSHSLTLGGLTKLIRASHSMRCVSMSTPIALASLNHHSQPPLPQPKRIEPTTLPKTKRPQPPQRQPSVIQIERAIGAGIFRDRDPRFIPNPSLLFPVFFNFRLLGFQFNFCWSMDNGNFGQNQGFRAKQDSI